MNLSQLDTFHKTRRGYVLFGVIEAGLVYLFGSLAINSGSLWEWTVTALLFLGVGQNFVKFMDTFLHGKKH